MRRKSSADGGKQASVGKTLKSRGTSEAFREAKKTPAREKTATKLPEGRKGEVDVLSMFADLYRQLY